MQKFLEAVDHVVTIEHQTDEREREVTAALVSSDVDCRHLHLLSGIATHFEAAADALLRASLIARSRSGRSHVRLVALTEPPRHQVCSDSVATPTRCHCRS